MLNIKNTTDGHLKSVEIKGNTIQDAENLADIRSVGDKVEGQELYKIDVVACGKNINTSFELGGLIWANGDITPASDRIRSINFIQVSPNKSIVLSPVGIGTFNIFEYDSSKKFIKLTRADKIVTSENTAYVKLLITNVTDINVEIQLEEGTVATSYEPYQGDKLTILSPVQLEKVGDVRDRIICKDGVWGVEKNVKTVVLDGSESYSNTKKGEDYIRTQTTLKESTLVGDIGIICDKLIYNKNLTYSASGEAISITSTGVLSISISKDKLNSYNNDGIKDFIAKNNLLLKFQTTQPTFIPLPHDQQVKLRTFAGQTNIHFETEIEPTIKAQVPKSIGATVNSHSEQIGNLSKELDRVKKLEESTVSTVTTESDFTTVEETSNGYFEDVKLEGRTLVNLAPKNLGQFTHTSRVSNLHFYDVPYSGTFKPSTTYTYVLNIIENTFDKYIMKLGDTYEEVDPTIWESNQAIESKTGIIAFTLTTKEVIDSSLKDNRCYIHGSDESDKKLVFSLMILEGDHTQNPPEYFEGLMSVGQDVDEMSVESVGTNAINLNSAECEDILTTITTDNNILTLKTTASNSAYVYIKCLLGKDIEYTLNMNINTNPQHIRLIDSDKSTTLKVFSMGTNMNEKFNVSKTGYYYLRFTINPNIEYIIKNLCIYIKDMSLDYKQDKKPLLYYDQETQTWEKPILRQWDSIEKHADGKYYYHKRSGEVVLNGSENGWGGTGNVSEDSIERSCSSVNIGKLNHICDKLPKGNTVNTFRNSTNGNIVIKLSKTIAQDGESFKAWLQANNVTVVYQLAQEEVYECTNIDLITYENETNYVVNCGAIAPKSILKVHSNISNVVKILQEKVSLLESNIKASQEVQDMMILETDMRMLDIELALMEHMPITLNLAENTMLRSATYFNFLKNHIINETYEKEYLENVMSKYLATNRLTQEEYDELYKMLYPLVYDIALPIEE